MPKQISGADTVIATNPTTGVVTVVPTVVGRKIENTPERTFSLATEYRLPQTASGIQRERRGCTTSASAR